MNLREPSYMIYKSPTQIDLMKNLSRNLPQVVKKNDKTLLGKRSSSRDKIKVGRKESKGNWKLETYDQV